MRLDLHSLAAARQRRRDAHEALVAEVGAGHLGVLAEAAKVLVRAVQSRREQLRSEAWVRVRVRVRVRVKVRVRVRVSN